uniref:Piercer of microtubule wall 1 n=1 Tax=Salmo trutta TaxID=8032 RepID=A0A674CED8_SALTR
MVPTLRRHFVTVVLVATHLNSSLLLVVVCIGAGILRLIIMDSENYVETHPSDDNEAMKTSDVYKVDKNLPKRFNNPDCFQGYSTKINHPFYQTSSQIYGSKRPTVHEMPTMFNGSYRKFSEHMLKSGMFRDNGFNTSIEKSKITGHDTIPMFQDRINFNYAYDSGNGPKN